MINWTKPYYGVQHLGEMGTGRHRVTVCDHGSFALLHKWFPGCAFSPTESTHANAAEARAEGEDYLKKLGHL